MFIGEGALERFTGWKGDTGVRVEMDRVMKTDTFVKKIAKIRGEGERIIEPEMRLPANAAPLPEQWYSESDVSRDSRLPRVGQGQPPLTPCVARLTYSTERPVKGPLVNVDYLKVSWRGSVPAREEGSSRERAVDA